MAELYRVIEEEIEADDAVKSTSLKLLPSAQQQQAEDVDDKDDKDHKDRALVNTESMTVSEDTELSRTLDDDEVQLSNIGQHIPRRESNSSLRSTTLFCRPTK